MEESNWTTWDCKLIGMIYSGLARCAWHQLSIAKAIVTLIKVEEDDMIEFGNMF